ncbi:MAG: 2-oxoacid:acceptor oxidoreductase subunit alpha [Syntrophorhabdales bacterium]
MLYRVDGPIVPKATLKEARSLDYTIKIGGEAGQGIQTIGDSLARVLARSGFHVFIHQDYESRIRGGHNFFQIRVSSKPVAASRERIDIVIALDRPSIANNEARLSEGGLILYDSSLIKEKHGGSRFLDVPLVDLATSGGGNRIMVNTVATGAALGLLKMGLEAFFQVIGELLGKKGAKTVDENRRAAARGHDFAKSNCKECAFEMGPGGSPHMLIDGNSAVGLGAVLSGCRFYSGYPMTPSTGVLTFMAEKSAEWGIVVEQAEDEIAAVNMAIGASFAGARSMTATAGGGFALMVEGISLAAMTETPIVVMVGQRPAPATGLPTRTEQGDLLFVLHAGHGEFPRVVLAPGSPEQALYLTNKAFDLCEKFQIPAFILSDQYLADSQWSYEGLDLDKTVYRDYRLRDVPPDAARTYRRYAYTASGVSPLAVPGQSECLVVDDSDEHDEEGHIIEDSLTRTRMVEKRLLKKLPLIRAEIGPPLLYGDRNPETVVVGWGSTLGVLKEVVDILSDRERIALLHFSEIYPFPGTEAFDYLKVLKEARQTICVENNATSQFGRLMRAETGHTFSSTITKYDGRPYLVETLLEELKWRD